MPPAPPSTATTGPYDLEQLSGEECLSEQPGEVPVAPPVFTPPTCEAPGTLVGVDTDFYTWGRTLPPYSQPQQSAK